MNAKFEWLGLSVARKHVYFYSLLIVGSVFANTIKDQFVSEPSENRATSELRRLAEQVSTFDSGSRY